MESVEEPPVDGIEPSEDSVPDEVLIEEQEYEDNDGNSNGQIPPAEIESGEVEPLTKASKRRRRKKNKVQAAVKGKSVKNQAAASSAAPMKATVSAAPPMKILPAVEEDVPPPNPKKLNPQLEEKLTSKQTLKKAGVTAAVMEKLKKEIFANDGVAPTQPVFGLTVANFHIALKAAMDEFNAKNGFHLLQPPPPTVIKDFTPDELNIANYTNANTWPASKRWEILNKLRGLPADQLTLDYLNIMIAISGWVKVRLERHFQRHRKQMRASRWKAIKEIGCALLHPPPLTDPEDMEPEEMDSAAVKACTVERKWAILNKLRGIPIHLLNNKHCHTIDQLCTVLKVKMDSAISQRRNEIITQRKVAKQLAMLVADGTNSQEEAPPMPQAYEAAVSSFAAANKKEEKQKFDHIFDFNADCKEYKAWPTPRKRDLFNKLKAIPLEELNREACHKMELLSKHLNYTLPEIFHQRRNELKKKNVQKAGGMPSQPHPVLGAQPSYHLPAAIQNHAERGIPGIPQLMSVNPMAFSQPAPSGPYGGFPAPFQQQPVPWGGAPPDFNGYPPMHQQYPGHIPPNYAHQEWVHQQQLQEQERMRQQQLQYQQQMEQQQYQQMMQPVAPSPLMTMAEIKRENKRAYTWTRSPSPKRMRQELPPPMVKLPLADMANSENYVLEEPVVTPLVVYRQPVTVQDMQATTDLVSLCQLRDAPAVTKPFLHPASRVIFDRISDYLGEGFKLQEECSSKTLASVSSIAGNIRYSASVWISGFSRIITLGEGVDMDQGQAIKFAYASAMAALCYMMVIPYQLFLVITKSGPDHVDLVLHACKPRIRHMIAVSRDPVFSALANYNGGLQVPDYLRDIWGTFINRMRHSGIELWDNSPVITVPRHMSCFNGEGIDDFYFKCEEDERVYVSWTGMAPVRGEIVGFDEKEFNRTGVYSRYTISQAEKGIISPQLLPEPNVYPPSDDYCHQLRHRHPQANPKDYDPVIHLPFRDLLCSHGIASRTIPMLSFFVMKYIGLKWNRPLVLKHAMEIEVNDGKERWKHVVTLNFEGVPFFFLGGRCRRDTFGSALLHAGAIIAEQLANMMIIPRELCYFLEKQGKDYAAVVIYVCRERFAAFEALVRNAMYASFHSIATATIDFKNPLYKRAETFFWRMRSTGFPYWVLHGQHLLVPISFGHKPHLPADAFFKFEATHQLADWTAINAAEGRVDTFHESQLKIEDRGWMIWEGGDRVKEEQEDNPITPEPAPLQLGPVAMNPGMMFENALKSDYQTPLAALSNEECTVVMNLLLTLAASCKKKGLELRTTKEFTATGREYFRYHISWSGNLSWILNATFESEKERDLQFGAAWTLYKMLIKMAIVPPGLFRFVGNNAHRLPYVVASIYPFLKLLESLLPQFKNHPDAENNHGLLMEQMRNMALTEWQSRTIQLPPHLMPCSEEHRRLPFIRVEAMSPRTMDNWKNQGHSQKYEKKAKVVDERGRDVNQLASKPQPGIKLSSRFTAKAKGSESTPQRLPAPEPVQKSPQKPAAPAPQEEDYDFDDELRQLEEMCKAPQAPPMPPGAASSTYYNYSTCVDTGDDEYL